jgi:amidase
MRFSRLTVFICLARLCAGADLSGDWVAQVSGGFGDPQYFRATLRVDGSKLTGSWNEGKLEGAVSGESVEFTAQQPGGRALGTFKGRMQAAELAGDGVMEGGRGGGGGRGGRQSIAWKMTRPAKAPTDGPKTWDFEPKEFYTNYSAAIPSALRIFPGDTVRSRTYDTTGRDAKIPHGSGGNPETGPFYIEGALPGDTLVVKLNRVRVNRDSARQGNRINGRAVTPAYVESAEYSPAFDSEWKLDREKGIAMLAHPTERMKNYKVPILPMIGCIATAPGSGQSFRTVDLGNFGGNMDYNQLGEGVTLYLPVFNPGGLLFFGDGHAAMGDGELTGSALETSLDIEFTTDLVKGYSTGNPRLENREYLMSVGVAGSVPDAIQIATSQLATWLKTDYKLNDNEVAVVLGTILKYDIAELVDPHFSVVAKVPKIALAGLK